MGEALPIGVRGVLLKLGIGAIAGVLGWGVWKTLAMPGQGLADLVLARVPESGVSNPVTAVLLNFRAYDTLLELAVLLVAVLAARVSPRTPVAGQFAPVSAVLLGLVRVLGPLIVLVAAYLLWQGAHAPGGAFQGGAVLATLGVLWALAGPPRWAAWGGLPSRLGLTLGLAAFLAVGLMAMTLGGALLEYPVGWAGTLILLIEAAALISIGLGLATLFARVDACQWRASTLRERKPSTGEGA
jgi:multisubunit Na+/H+ antiporter MnhB subunit